VTAFPLSWPSLVGRRRRLAPRLFASIALAAAVVTAPPAEAAKKKKAEVSKPEASEQVAVEPQPQPLEAQPESKPEGQPSLDFNFFDQGAGASPAAPNERPNLLADPAAEAKAETRRWMLRTHQTLGIATWMLMVGTVVIGQLNYNELYGGGGSTKWQTSHRILVISTSTTFAATAAFAIFAPTPYKKPLRFDTGLVHRIAVTGAALGMAAEAILGWETTHRANAGNPHSLRTLARTHQVIGYTTLGFLTIAGAVWFF
jgi:hypothetical protein